MARRSRPEVAKGDLPGAIRRLPERWMKHPGGDRAFVEWLLAGRQHGLETLEVACGLALEPGTLTAAVGLNPLHRLLSPRPPETLPTPERLRLTLEPEADGARPSIPQGRLRPAEAGHARLRSSPH